MKTLIKRKIAKDVPKTIIATGIAIAEPNTKIVSTEIKIKTVVQPPKSW